MDLTCEALGITREDIIERMVSRLCDSLYVGDPGMGELIADAVETRVTASIHAKVNEAVTRVLDNTLGNGIEPYVLSMRFPRTNRYGERKEDPLTIREWCEQKVHEFLKEKVDDRGQVNGYGEHAPRIERAVSATLANEIDRAVQTAMKDGAKTLGEVVLASVRDHIATVQKTLRVEVKSEG